MNKKKNPQSSKKSNKFQKNTKPTNNVEIKNQSKEIQCRECEGFGHIQSECANTLKKKEKSLKTTWSDSDSDDIEDVTTIVIMLDFKLPQKRMHLLLLQRSLQRRM